MTGLPGRRVAMGFSLSRHGHMDQAHNRTERKVGTHARQDFCVATGLELGLDNQGRDGGSLSRRVPLDAGSRQGSQASFVVMESSLSRQRT